MTRWISLAAALTALACSATTSVQTALHGDLTALKRAIRVEQKEGDLDRGRVRDLAAAVAGRELRSARGQAAALRVRRARSCSSSLLPVLRDRARKLDDAGAEAALLLFDKNEYERESLILRYKDASSGAWRAVAARATNTRTNGALRREFMRDADERARRAALLAAIEVGDPADLPELLEAARLDPDGLSRALATRAAGAIGGTRAVLALNDLWSRADETARLAIVEAWAMNASFVAGGREQLTTTAESMSGLPAVAAAEALSRKGGASGELGATILARAVREGTEAERRLAIRIAPFWDKDVRSALVKASADTELEVRVEALTRLGENARSRAAALAALRVLAKGNDSIALRARAALAGAGDSSIRPRLLEQLGRRSAEDRRMAALSLLELGDYASAASALADDDPDVRADVACSVLSGR